MTTIRLGTCSPAPASSPQAALALLETVARRAAGQGVDVLLLPEAFLGGGCPRGVRFGGVLGAADAAGREAFLRCFQQAVDFGDVVGDAGAGGGDAWLGQGRRTDDGGQTRPQPGPGGDGTREALERIARQTGVFLVVGAVERAGGSLYCAVVYVCPSQGVLGKRRKIQPTGLERLIWSTAGPASLRAVSATVKGVRINLAAAICWENYMPLVRQALYAQNVSLYLAPAADGGDAWLSLMRTIGIEGRCFVVTSSMCTTGCDAQDPPLPVAGRATPSAPATARQPIRDANDVTDSADSIHPWEQQQQQLPQQPNVSPGGTRGAITTKIVSCAATNGKPRRRKKSFVVDADGNEIVLSCQTVDEEGGAEEALEPRPENGIHGPAAAAGAPEANAPELSPLPPFPQLPPDTAWERHKNARRRSSVFDEDDNEIVLCRPADSGPSTEQALESPTSETIPTGADKERAPAAPNVLDSQASPGPTARALPVAGTRGGSAIVSPFGEVLAGPQSDDADGIVTADVDFGDCIRGRLNMDVAGHDSRLSVTGLDLSPLPY